MYTLSFFPYFGILLLLERFLLIYICLDREVEKSYNVQLNYCPYGCVPRLYNTWAENDGPYNNGC